MEVGGISSFFGIATDAANDPYNHGILNLDDNTNSIIISAPHAQRAYRYSESDNTHSRDLYTGAYAQILHEITGMPTIIAKYKSDDPNYYHAIPPCTITDEFLNNVGDLLPYKQKILGDKPRFAIEAGVINGWEKFVPSENFLGMKSFGESGPYKKLYEHFGITVANLIKMIKKNI